MDTQRFPGHIRKVHLAVLTAALLTGSVASNVTAAPPLPACDDRPQADCESDNGARQVRFWSLTGNAGTKSSVNFLGTLDNQALQIKVNNQRVLLLVPNPTSPDLVGGFVGNSVAVGVQGATVGGGGENTHPNMVTAGLFGTIGGGVNNTLSGSEATIAGGSSNAATSKDAAICGGVNNVASGFVATVCGGDSNSASGSWSFATGRGNSASGIAATVGGGEGSGASGRNATISGGQDNQATADFATVGGGQRTHATAQYATISGGQDNTANGFAAVVGGGHDNTASEIVATIGGGFRNTASGGFATIGGGFDNIATGFGATIGGGGNGQLGDGNRVFSQLGTVGGGIRNQVGDAAGGGSAGTIAGGVENTATGEESTVAGGEFNRSRARWSTIGGGIANEVTGNQATIPGGNSNLAQGDRSFAAGTAARAQHEGAFVWADSTFVNFTSTAANQFSVRAAGGARFVSAVAADGSPTAGVALAPGGGSWSSLSDRAVKTNIASVDHRALLERLFSVPIQTWSYTSQDPSIRHIGPMAQDFAAAFGVGENERYIDTVDAQGVALASIQGLYELVQEKDTKIESQHQRITVLEQQVATLDARLSALERGTNSGTGLPDGWPLIGGVMLAGLGLRQRGMRR